MDVDTTSEPVNVWDRLLKEKPAHATKRLVEAGLSEFSKKKKILLDRLHAACCMVWLPGLRQPIKKPFDERAAWRRLNGLAAMYFLRQAMPSARTRVKGLRKLAKALGQVCNFADKVRRDNLGGDLISQLFDGVLPRDPAGQLVRDDDGTLRPVHFSEIQLKEIVRGLNEYEAAVLRAALDVPSRRPGKQPIMPENYVGALADLYLDFTGRKPGAGGGPFYRFVLQVRGALDPSYKTIDASGDERVDESLIEAIKYGLRWWKRARGGSTKRTRRASTK